MKFSTVATTVALFFGAVSAQTACAPAASAVPSCGVPCIQSAAGGVGCGAEDLRCRCSNSDAIQSAAIGCVLDACGFLDALQVQASASAVCSCVATATGARLPRRTAAY